jgi:hypothetical protein
MKVQIKMYNGLSLKCAFLSIVFMQETIITYFRCKKCDKIRKLEIQHLIANE